jgi:isoleucyl-tRNA synthetase
MNALFATPRVDLDALIAPGAGNREFPHAGINTPEDVEAMGIDKYNEECRAIVMRYSQEWQQTVSRLGRWIDFVNDYKTLHTSFMESVWWVFGQLWEKGLVYRGFKVGILV